MLKNIENAMPTLASMYAKRILEKYYDKLSATEIFTRLKNMNDGEKHIVEFMLYILSSFLDQKMDENTAVKKFLREIGIDAPPEVAKRIMNHDNSAKKLAPEKSSLLGLFLGLGIKDDELMEIADWLSGLEKSQREKALNILGSLTQEDLKRISQMNPDKKREILKLIERGFFSKKSFSEKTKESYGEILGELNTWLKTKL